MEGRGVGWGRERGKNERGLKWSVGGGRSLRNLESKTTKGGKTEIFHRGEGVLKVLPFSHKNFNPTPVQVLFFCSFDCTGGSLFILFRGQSTAEFINSLFETWLSDRIYLNMETELNSG